MQIGDIVIFKYLVFEESKADHAFDRGRPCIYIGSIDDKMYFISLHDATNWSKEIAKYIIKPDSKNRLKKDTAISLSNLIEKKSSFYKVFGYINDEQIFNIFESIKQRFRNPKTESDLIFIKLADKYFESINFVDKDKKNNCIKKIK